MCCTRGNINTIFRTQDNRCLQLRIYVGHFLENYIVIFVISFLKLSLIATLFADLVELRNYRSYEILMYIDIVSGSFILIYNLILYYNYLQFYLTDLPLIFDIILLINLISIRVVSFKYDSLFIPSFYCKLLLSISYFNDIYYYLINFIYTFVKSNSISCFDHAQYHLQRITTGYNFSLFDILNLGYILNLIKSDSLFQIIGEDVPAPNMKNHLKNHSDIDSGHWNRYNQSNIRQSLQRLSVTVQPFASYLNICLTGRSNTDLRHSGLQPKRENTYRAAAAFQNSERWNITEYKRYSFDVFKFNTEHNNCLVQILHVIFDYYGICDKLNFNPQLMTNLITKIELGYVDTPYHNKVHAADVVQGGFFFLNDYFFREVTDTFPKFCFLFACAIHDYKHPGTDNAFEVESGSDLAILYNDQAVLENMHVSSALNLLKTSKYNPFTTWLTERFLSFRHLVISLVLSTDFSMHNKIIQTFRTDIIEQQNFELNEYKLSTVYSMLIHCADVMNPTRPTEVAYQWAKNYTEEQFNIGDKRKSLGLPFSAFMDRESPNIVKNQLGFINFVIKPLYTNLNGLFNISEALDNIENNITFWSNYTGIYSEPIFEF